MLAKLNNKINFKFIIIPITLICLIILIFNIYIIYKKNNNSTVGDIAYDKNRFVNNIVYLKENGVYAPYIVVTNNYHGKTLLLRKECLENNMYISEYYSYYENSSMDTYLNTEFLKIFSKKLNDKFINTNIEIISKESIGKSGSKTITIKRKAFLLSATELGFNITYEEGERLKYFNNIDNRLANDYNNKYRVSYWLRSANTFNLSTSYVITDENKLTFTNSSDVWNGAEHIYVRPAISINSETKIEKNKFIIKGSEVYVINY